MNRVFLGILIFVLAGCSRSDEPETDESICLSGLAEHRSSVDADFAADENPLSEEQKTGFTGLNYFPPSADYCFPASFKTTDASETFEMPTYNEKSMPFREYGIFKFRVDEVDYSLTAYQRMDLPDDERQWVLVPFKDGTNGHGTYGGGRYLEIKLPIDALTELDFNRASNPWCAYDAKYTCPVPPVGNWLNLSISAGEKTFAINQSDSS
jgi:hypothetical protein